MPEQQISVKISGTPVRKGGFIPIVNINEAFFEIDDSYPAIMSGDACVYTVSVLPDMTVYKLVFNRMRHHGDSTESCLIIGFSIPAGYKLPEGTDASGVLHSMLEAFIGSFALALPDGSFEYRFGRFDTAPLENVCESVKIIPADSPRVEMKAGAPRGAIEVKGDRIATTLSCLDREEHADISELIVAEHINASVGGIGKILKDESTVTEKGGEDFSEDTDCSVPETADTAYENSATAMPVESDEGNSLRNNDLYPHKNDRYDDISEERESSRGRRLWPALLVGVLLGAVIAYLAFRVLGTHSDGQQVMSVPADTSAVGQVLDTVAPARVETVFIEKKIVEKPRPTPSAKRKEMRPRAAGMSTSSQQHDEERPVPSEESTPAPVYKYDPEAERSL